MTAPSGLPALAAAAFAPPPEGAIPPGLEALVRHACAGAWRAIEVVLAGDVLRGRLSKTRDSIVRDAVDGVLSLFGNVGIRADALASLRAAREAGALDGALDVASIVDAVRTHGAVAVGRTAVADVRRALAAYRDLEAVLADHELASLLIDAARACFRGAAHDPTLATWAIGPTGSPGRDRALAAFAELAASPDSLAELETLISLPIHLDENVQFTVYRPRAIDPGTWHQLLAFAHLAERRPGEEDLPDPVEEVQRQAASVLGPKAKQYQPVVQDSGSAIPAEGELTFVPEFPGIEVNPPRRSFLWLETVHREEFRIRAGRELDGKTVRGRLTVFLGHIAIAEVALSVRVDAARPEPKVREPQHARAYRKIFASYSHRDIAIVNQFETYARALGDEYLRDWVHLRTGEVWNDRLCQLIEQADAFQLFWSRNSMHSTFVRQEYEHALSLDRPSFVRPTYWEEPMPTGPGLPPEALLRLHFQKLGAEMVGQVGAGSRADALPGVAKKKTADVDLERPSETMRTLSREVTDAMAGAEEAIDAWGPSDQVAAPTCASCGGTNEAAAAFCRHCGSQLGARAKEEVAKSRKSMIAPDSRRDAKKARPAGRMPPPAVADRSSTYPVGDVTDRTSPEDVGDVTGRSIPSPLSDDGGDVTGRSISSPLSDVGDVTGRSISSPLSDDVGDVTDRSIPSPLSTDDEGSVPVPVSFDEDVPAESESWPDDEQTPVSDTWAIDRESESADVKPPASTRMRTAPPRSVAPAPPAPARPASARPALEAPSPSSSRPPGSGDLPPAPSSRSRPQAISQSRSPSEPNSSAPAPSPAPSSSRPTAPAPAFPSSRPNAPAPSFPSSSQPTSPSPSRPSAPAPSSSQPTSPARPSAPAPSSSQPTSPARPSAPAPSSPRPSAPAPSASQPTSPARPSAPVPSSPRPSAPVPSSPRPSAPAPSSSQPTSPARPSAPAPSSSQPTSPARPSAPAPSSPPTSPSRPSAPSPSYPSSQPTSPPSSQPSAPAPSYPSSQPSSPSWPSAPAPSYPSSQPTSPSWPSAPAPSYPSSSQPTSPSPSPPSAPAPSSSQPTSPSRPAPSPSYPSSQPNSPAPYPSSSQPTSPSRPAPSPSYPSSQPNSPAPYPSSSQPTSPARPSAPPSSSSQPTSPSRPSAPAPQQRPGPGAPPPGRSEPPAPIVAPVRPSPPRPGPMSVPAIPSRPSPVPSQPRADVPSIPARPSPMPSQPRMPPAVPSEQPMPIAAQASSPLTSSSSASPDSWTNEDQKEMPRPRLSVPPSSPSAPISERPSVPLEATLAERSSAPSLFPPSPVSRTSSAPRPVVVDPAAPKLFPSEPEHDAAVAPGPALTTTQPMVMPERRPSTPSQPPSSQQPSLQQPPITTSLQQPPITTTLPGVHLDDVPSATVPPMSSPAIRPPAPTSSSSSPPIASSVAPGPMKMMTEPPPAASSVGPGPMTEPAAELIDISADIADSIAAADPMSSEVASPAAARLKHAEVSPFAATLPQPAYDPSDDELAVISKKVGAPKFANAPGPDGVQPKLPEAPDAHGWVLAVVIVLIVVAAVIVVLLL